MGTQENRPSPTRLLTSARWNPRAMAAMPRISCSSLIASARIMQLVSGKAGPGPAPAAGILDESVFQVQLHDLQTHRREGLDGRPLPRTEAGEHQLAPGA